ncbi:hypothetical protein Cob_v004963 [Colletotrichum orbiculare MAFF 240422]|uniref:Uncharacterized protein n=1 Tax=Colletotrichum orbiculare (strain 104-T / ATCC 96160 / CBS 514.97 / LARS 414 / MAFF 240422) TaxID=1213857 RepID=A0A484FWD6_COLOR|nr:hypothetical protein Cob_v004963 [Colletotrichum orbiculare MAFF 240422]
MPFRERLPIFLDDRHSQAAYLWYPYPDHRRRQLAKTHLTRSFIQNHGQNRVRFHQLCPETSTSSTKVRLLFSDLLPLSLY